MALTTFAPTDSATDVAAATLRDGAALVKDDYARQYHKDPPAMPGEE